MSELSRRSGVPVATIKYYLREGLLPQGQATARNQADYSELHLRRLKLIRALIGVRGLSVSETGEVLRGVSAHASDMHQMLGLVLGARPIDKASAAPSREAFSEVDQLLAQVGWKVSEQAPAKHAIAETLTTLRSLGMDVDWRTLLPYAKLAHRTAVVDLDQLQDADEPIERAERAVVLTVLLESVLLALRRLAQEDESAKRHGA